MTLISYAQNFEDVILWRALKHIKNGCYIDIGAQDPVIDSVSKIFYDHGWRGIHVEPMEEYAAKIRISRPGEIVEQIAIGTESTKLTFYGFPDSGLSTADVNIAEQHIKRGFRCSAIEVPTLSLDQLLGKYSGKEIHWLKIDVEGFEKQVLESWTNANNRPWVIVIESTLPLTQTESHQNWEHLVLKKGYEFAYFDGLNRFYVSMNHHSLIHDLSLPPNIFDRFAITKSHALATSLVQQSEQLQQMLENQLFEQQAVAKAMSERLKKIEANVLWKMTWPIRFCMHSAQRLSQLVTRSRNEPEPLRFLFLAIASKLENKARGSQSIKTVLKYLFRTSPQLARLVRCASGKKVPYKHLKKNLTDTERRIFDEVVSKMARGK